jgi:flagellar hook-basal body complex protein FliE
MDITPIVFNLPPIETPLLKGGVSYNEKGAGLKGTNFGDTLAQAMNNLKDLHDQAEVKMANFAAGGDVDVADVMVSMEKASMATELAIQIRNKFLDGYQEIIRMQI